MRRNTTDNWPLVALGIGIVAITLIGLAIAQVVNNSSTSTVDLTGTSLIPETATTEISLTIDVAFIKRTQDASVEQTRQAALQTPWWFAATVPPSQTVGPTATPDFSGFEHQDAGAGVIVWDTITVKGYPMGVINQWYQIPKGIRVLAGAVTDDPEQGAVAVLAPGVNFESPEIYLTHLKVGPVELQDAQGERLILRAINGGNLFYFDLPTRQFVDGFTVTVVAPTVTPWPTFTQSPTLQPVPSPTFGLPPTAYPGLPPTSNGYPAPALQTITAP